MSWRPIETAPKDGTEVLLGGRYKPFDIHPGDEWCTIIAAYTSFSSARPDADQQWISSLLTTLDHWNVDFTHWMPLPTPPSS